MSITFGTIKLAKPTWTQRAFALLIRFRDAVQARRQRARLQTRLSDLNDRELHDIGLARGEIDYVAAQAAAGSDPRYVGHPAADSGGGGQEGKP